MDKPRKRQRERDPADRNPDAAKPVKRNETDAQRKKRFAKLKYKRLQYLPERTKQRYQEELKVKRAFNRERPHVEPIVVPEYYFADDGDDGGGGQDAPALPKKLTKAEKAEAEKKEKIAANVQGELDKLEQERRKRKRELKRKQMRQRTSKGNPVMKNMIGDMLEKIQKQKQ